ncbi:hypothetical protein ECANGB1_248 [Enterospora canceri]|uniref:Uncharacterized protein n=1 Tax=Enterospora canceri TaxID=1081671 RepID=A0A1Y1S878_9MICR|nr:hypothetical protein ECANGB1_248 [Enterospora canceri]
MKCVRNYKREFTDRFKWYYPLERAARISRCNGILKLLFLDKEVVIEEDEIESVSMGMYSNTVPMNDAENILYKKGVRILETMYRKTQEKRQKQQNEMVEELEEERARKFRKNNGMGEEVDLVETRLNKIELVKLKEGRKRPMKSGRKKRKKVKIEESEGKRKRCWNRRRGAVVLINTRRDANVTEHVLSDYNKVSDVDRLINRSIIDILANKASVGAVEETGVLRALDMDGAEGSEDGKDDLKTKAKKIEEYMKIRNEIDKNVRRIQTEIEESLKQKEGMKETDRKHYDGMVGDGSYTPTYIDISEEDVHKFMKYEEAVINYGDRYLEKRIQSQIEPKECKIDDYLSEVEEPKNIPKKRGRPRTKKKHDEICITNTHEIESRVDRRIKSRIKHKQVTKSKKMAPRVKISIGGSRMIESSLTKTVRPISRAVKKTPMKYERLEEEKTKNVDDDLDVCRIDTDCNGSTEESFEISEIEEPPSKVGRYEMEQKSSRPKRGDEHASFVAKNLASSSPRKTRLEIETSESSCVVIEGVGYDEISGVKKCEDSGGVRLEKSSTVTEDESAKVLPKMDPVDSDTHSVVEVVKGILESSHSNKGADNSQPSEVTGSFWGYSESDQNNQSSRNSTKSSNSKSVDECTKMNETSRTHFDKLIKNMHQNNEKHSQVLTNVCLCYSMVSPEYEITRQNDVFMCEALFYESKFNSSYEYTKKEAKEAVAKLILEYMNDNWESVIELGEKMKKDAIGGVHSN